MFTKDLTPNSKNPRKISPRKLEMLRESLARFGDLSGFVFNRRSQTLISGHQKQKTISPDTEVVIEIRHPAPTAARTVAEGYVFIDGERYKYREVDADEAWETEAMISANKQGGEWDQDKLRQVLFETPNLNIQFTGFEVAEFEPPQIPPPQFPGGDSTSIGDGSGVTVTDAPAPRPTLADRFLIPPFSTFNAREGWWQDRKRQWIALGIKSELGRGCGGAVASNKECNADSGHFYRKENAASSEQRAKISHSEQSLQTKRTFSNEADATPSKMAFHNDPMVRKNKYDEK